MTCRVRIGRRNHYGVTVGAAADRAARGGSLERRTRPSREDLAPLFTTTSQAPSRGLPKPAAAAAADGGLSAAPAIVDAARAPSSLEALLFSGGGATSATKSATASNSSGSLADQAMDRIGATLGGYCVVFEGRDPYATRNL